MKEYIERDAAMESIIGLTIVDPAVAQYANAVYYNLQNLSAADVAPVRHGRWVDENKNPIPWYECNSKCPSHSAYCSECGEWLTASDEYPVTGLYCPNCGALMKEIENGEK